MPFSTPSYAYTLVGGFAAFLAENGAGVWDDFGNGTPYTTGSAWPIYLGPDMPVSPSRLIVLTPGVQTRIRADVIQNMQIRLRGNAADPDQLGAALDDVLGKTQEILDLVYPNGFPRAHVQLGPVRVGAIIPGDILPLASDGNRRPGATLNIRIRARRPRPE